MYSTEIFFICYKLSNLTAKIGKPEKSKFGGIDSSIVNLKTAITTNIGVFRTKCLVYYILLIHLWDYSVFSIFYAKYEKNDKEIYKQKFKLLLRPFFQWCNKYNNHFIFRDLPMFHNHNFRRNYILKIQVSNYFHHKLFEFIVQLQNHFSLSKLIFNYFLIFKNYLPTVSTWPGFCDFSVLAWLCKKVYVTNLPTIGRFALWSRSALMPSILSISMQLWLKAIVWSQFIALFPVAPQDDLEWRNSVITDTNTTIAHICGVHSIELLSW